MRAQTEQPVATEKVIWGEFRGPVQVPRSRGRGSRDLSADYSFSRRRLNIVVNSSVDT
jgi:hypothetical protein